MKPTGDMNRTALAQNCDGIVMLTWSNWFSEMRSNRYHYATRFSRLLPVIFVQPDLLLPGFYFENTEFENITVLRIYKHPGEKRASLLKAALNEISLRLPLLWIYNSTFEDSLNQFPNSIRILHATESYFTNGLLNDSEIEQLRRILCAIDLLVAVSPGVAESYQVHGNYAGRMLLATNGCDFKFWSLRDPNLEANRIALYQGGIHRKLDFSLLIQIAEALPSWTFHFCGEVTESPEKLAQLLRLPNTQYHGVLSPESVLDLASNARVGLIPFVQDDYIKSRAFPLKAFEYLAAGLDVVSVPIDALIPYGEHFYFCSDSKSFIEALTNIESTPRTSIDIARKRALARNHDYDDKFASVTKDLISLFPLARKTYSQSNNIKRIPNIDRSQPLYQTLLVTAIWKLLTGLISLCALLTGKPRREIRDILIPKLRNSRFTPLLKKIRTLFS